MIANIVNLLQKRKKRLLSDVGDVPGRSAILRERDCLMNTVLAKKKIPLVHQTKKLLKMKTISKRRKRRMRLL